MDLSLPASYLLLFFTASFLGWCMEVICKLIQFGRFINRGFLIGPWCPIYGFGTVLITLLLSKFTDDPLAVFALAMLLCGTPPHLLPPRLNSFLTQQARTRNSDTNCWLALALWPRR